MNKKRYEYQYEWEKRNCTKKTFKFTNNTDADIISHLDKQPNMLGYIKRIIREDIEREGS